MLLMTYSDQRMLPFLSASKFLQCLSLHHLHCFLTVGPSGIPCQLMMGFFAYAKSLEIDVDKEELEGIYTL